MDEYYFTFNGVDSRELGICVVSMPPRIRPARRYEEYTVPARGGTARVWDGAYEAMSMPVGIYLPYEQGGTVAELEQIMRQLDGTGWLTLSDRPGRWWATVTGSVDYSAWIQGFEDRTATVMFEADPWRYANEPRTEVLTDAGAVQNDGTEAADPEITVTGSGDIVLMIGQQITQLNGVTGGVVIDVPGGMILNPDGEPIENGLDGDMPVIEPGWNAVSWTGSVTSVKFTYNERSIGC